MIRFYDSSTLISREIRVSQSDTCEDAKRTNSLYILIKTASASQIGSGGV